MIIFGVVIRTIKKVYPKCTVEEIIFETRAKNLDDAYSKVIKLVDIYKEAAVDEILDGSISSTFVTVGHIWELMNEKAKTYLGICIATVDYSETEGGDEVHVQVNYYYQ